jgi:hypothetical protein
LRAAGVEIEENIAALPEFFLYRYVMPPATLYKDILQAIAGEHLQFDFSDHKSRIMSIDTYIPPSSEIDPTTPLYKNFLNHLIPIFDEILSTFRDSSSVIAFLLSGGLDEVLSISVEMGSGGHLLVVDSARFDSIRVCCTGIHCRQELRGIEPPEGLLRHLQ